MDNILSLTDPGKTHDSLSNAFAHQGHINESELNASIILCIRTSKELQYQLSSHRLAPEQVVWKALITIANECLSMDETRRYTATVPQLEQWLTQYGNGAETLRESMKYAESSANVMTWT